MRNSHNQNILVQTPKISINFSNKLSSDPTRESPPYSQHAAREGRPATEENKQLLPKERATHLKDDQAYDVGPAVLYERVLETDVYESAEIDSHAIVPEGVVLGVLGVESEVADRLQSSNVVFDKKPKLLLELLGLVAMDKELLLLL